MKRTTISLMVAGLLATAGGSWAQQGGVSGSAGVSGSGQSEPSNAAADRRSYRGALPQTDAVMNPMRPQGAPSAGGTQVGAAPAVRTQSGAVNPAGLSQSDAGFAQRSGAPGTSLPVRPSREAIERSDEVTQLQQQLLLRGYSPGPADGALGAQTRAALRDFQKTEGMPITGDLTEQTKMMLGIGVTNAGARPFSRAAAPPPGRPAGATAPSR